MVLGLVTLLILSAMVSQSRHQLKFQSLLAGRAHFMRHNGTVTEQMLWRCLASKRLGVAFKRQVVVDRFVVDYLAPSIRLVVEVDGKYHSYRISADARRDRVLQRLGYRLRMSSTPKQLPDIIRS